MIISKTPLRVSLLGGGSDLPGYYKDQVGYSIGMSINSYIHISYYETLLKNNYILKYSETEKVSNLDDIKHRMIRAAFCTHQISHCNLTSEASIPSGSGLGSSSAFAVGLLNICNYLNNRSINKVSLAKQACDLEINKLKSPIGKQDQFLSALGGINFLEFHPNETVNIERIHLKKEQLKELENNLILVSVGSVRDANIILKEQQENLKQDSKVQSSTKALADLAFEFKENFQNNFTDLPEYLNEAWKIKRGISSKISNHNLDYFYETGIKNGAKGGKLLGAGGGGFFLFYCDKPNQKNLLDALRKPKSLSISVDEIGTRLVDLKKH